MLQNGKKIKGYKYPKHKLDAGTIGRGVGLAGRLVGEMGAQAFGVNMNSNIQSDARRLGGGIKRAAGDVKRGIGRVINNALDQPTNNAYQAGQKAQQNLKRKSKKHKSKRKVMCKKKHKHMKSCK